jgi:hypothetical protein
MKAWIRKKFLFQFFGDSEVLLKLTPEEAQTLYQVLASVSGTEAAEVATKRIQKLRYQLYGKGFESGQGLLVFNDSMESLIQEGVSGFNQRLVKEG